MTATEQGAEWEKGCRAKKQNQTASVSPNNYVGEKQGSNQAPSAAGWPARRGT